MDDPKVEALIERIDRLESRLQLADLIAEYSQTFDRGDLEGFVQVWWSDCTWAIGPHRGTFHGHDGIREAAEEVLWSVWATTHHSTSNHQVTFASPDAAQGRCDLNFTGTTVDGDAMILAATYDDEYERREGAWKLRRRNVSVHYLTPLPGVTLLPPT